MPPLTKKKKTSDTSHARYTFQVAGMKADTCLNVFGQEFYVCSMVLKSQSMYFRKSFDLAGSPKKSGFSSFPTELFTRVEYDGSWALTADLKYRDVINATFFGDIPHEQACFEKLLCALFNRPYTISNVYELTTLAEYGTQYSTLPLLSNSLYGALHRSPNIIPVLQEDPRAALIAAKTFHNELLFKDAFILSLGPFSEPACEDLQDPILIKLAKPALQKLRQMVDHANKELHKLTDTAEFPKLLNLPKNERGDDNEVAQAFAELMASTTSMPLQNVQDIVAPAKSTTEPETSAPTYIDHNTNSGKPLLWPCYFRALNNTTHLSQMPASTSSKIRQLVKPLVGNNLALYPQAQAGKQLPIEKTEEQLVLMTEGMSKEDAKKLISEVKKQEVGYPDERKKGDFEDWFLGVDVSALVMPWDMEVWDF